MIEQNADDADSYDFLSICGFYFILSFSLC